MAQTSIAANPTAGIAGDLASPLNGSVIVSKRAAEAIPFGVFVVLTADDEDTCELPDAAGEATGGRGLGVALRKPEDVSGAYAAGEEVKILSVGEVWVEVETGATAGTHAYVRHTDGGSDQLGQLDDAADGSEQDQTSGVTFTTTIDAAGGLAKVRLDRPFEPVA
jgi:hypothetical protein